MSSRVLTRASTPGHKRFGRRGGTGSLRQSPKAPLAALCRSNTSRDATVVQEYKSLTFTISRFTRPVGGEGKVGWRKTAFNDLPVGFFPPVKDRLSSAVSMRLGEGPLFDRGRCKTSAFGHRWQHRRTGASISDNVSFVLQSRRPVKVHDGAQKAVSRQKGRFFSTSSHRGRGFEIYETWD